MQPVSQGTWREAYGPPGKPITLIHEGGPADGTQTTVPLTALPHVRYYAPTAQRRRRTVKLARYVRHDPVDLDVIRYVYTGIDERHGPCPGHKESPAWS